MRGALLCGAAALGLAAIPAQAQTVPDSQVRKSAAAFAECSVGQAGGAWRRQLLRPYGDTATHAMMSRLLDGACSNQPGWDQVLKAPRLQFRSFIFDALYRADFGDAPQPADLAGLQPLVYPVAEGLNEENARPYLVSVAFGDCVARQDPAGARAFMLSRVETAGETAALQALAPAFQNCVPQGAELTLTRSKARATLAEPLYRLTQARVKP
ncbi:hypothetical protein OF829_11310 [Sphingomonas sp. LB-2]|uniref:hypothetical protein n=1 Tax=Sphingomonas caeni TaxID=2984949 RepID=UPI0022308ECE|nr:hypothetical protein [Sphingomonas caeni]MCW3847828.1 hypothetical protein [Sphingomonas caeni]